MTDIADPTALLLFTRWSGEEAFRAWNGSDLHRELQERMPGGLTLDPSFMTVTVGTSMEWSRGTHNLSEALEGQTVALSRWLTESDSVLAVLLAPDGTILQRNPAGRRIMPPDSSPHSGLRIWDYLVSSDLEPLRRLLLGAEADRSDRILLNLTNGQQDPVTFEIGLVRCDGAILLLGTREYGHDSQFEVEMHTLNNELTVMAREATRKSRQLTAANDRVGLLARTDGLTGLANRRALDETLPREIARANRGAGSLSLVMADLDRFKSVNDDYGHVTGDHFLVLAAAVFAKNSRSYDVASRYGGEEMCLLLPGTSTDEAVSIADRVRSGIEKITVPGCPRQITLSLGVATWLPGEGPEALVARADAALYTAKRYGGNRVESSPGVVT